MMPVWYFKVVAMDVWPANCCTTASFTPAMARWLTNVRLRSWKVQRRISARTRTYLMAFSGSGDPSPDGLP